jgi:hypothetical protein
MYTSSFQDGQNVEPLPLDWVGPARTPARPLRRAGLAALATEFAKPALAAFGLTQL